MSVHMIIHRLHVMCPVYNCISVVSWLPLWSLLLCDSMSYLEPERALQRYHFCISQAHTDTHTHTRTETHKHTQVYKVKWINVQPQNPKRKGLGMSFMEEGGRAIPVHRGLITSQAERQQHHQHTAVSVLFVLWFVLGAPNVHTGASDSEVK